MDYKQCIPMTWCPSNYYKDVTLKTCSTECSREKYIDENEKKCIDKCDTGYYVG